MFHTQGTKDCQSRAGPNGYRRSLSNLRRSCSELRSASTGLKSIGPWRLSSWIARTTRGPTPLRHTRQCRTSLAGRPSGTAAELAISGTAFAPATPVRQPLHESPSNHHRSLKYAQGGAPGHPSSLLRWIDRLRQQRGCHCPPPGDGDAIGRGI